MTFTEDERDIVAAETLLVRQCFPERRRSFPFLIHHGLVERRLRRKGLDVDRRAIASALLDWARMNEDVRLVVYRPLVRVLGPDLPDLLSHAARVVDRHSCFEQWIVDGRPVDEGYA